VCESLFTCAVATSALCRKRPSFRRYAEVGFPLQFARAAVPATYCNCLAAPTHVGFPPFASPLFCIAATVIFWLWVLTLVTGEYERPAAPTNSNYGVDVCRIAARDSQVRNSTQPSGSFHQDAEQLPPDLAAHLRFPQAPALRLAET